MTREDAITYADCLKNNYTINFDDMADFCDMAIKALEKEPCEDVISRDELLKAIDTWDKFGCDADTKLVPYQDHYIPYIHYDDVVKCIKGMPSVTPKPKTGHWINIDATHSKCDSCGAVFEIASENGEVNFCPNCGARMIEKGDDKE